MITSTAPSSNSLLLGPNDIHDFSLVESDCFKTLRVFLAPGHITQLVALDVQEPGYRKPIAISGFFDYDHLDLMACAAAELSGRAKGVHFTLNPLKAEVLERCPNRVQCALAGVLAREIDVLCRRWFLIDIDPKRAAGVSASNAEKRLALEVLHAVSCFLSSYGFPNAIIGDSGNGYHLYFRIDLPAEDQLPHRILKLLNEKFGSEVVSIDTSVAKASQLTKLFGTLSAKGHPTNDRPHRYSTLLSVSHLEPVDRETLSGIFVPAEPSVVANSPIVLNQAVIIRARSYLTKIPRSVAGNHGHDRLFEAACRLVKSFGLSIDHALPLLREYNQEAIPPWPEEELVRKLQQAVDRPDPRPPGYLLHSETRSPASVQANLLPVEAGDEASVVLPGTMFPISVPDFIPVPTFHTTEYLEQRFIELPRGRPRFEGHVYMLWLALFAIFEQRNSQVWIPDAVMASGIGGASPSDDWQARLIDGRGNQRHSVEAMRRQHRRLKNDLERMIPALQEIVNRNPEAEHEPLIAQTEAIVVQINELIQKIPNERCPPQCLMHGSGIRHEHYIVRPNEAVWRELSDVATPTASGHLQFDFNKKIPGESKTIVDSLVHANKVHYAYLPVQLFGQAAGLNVRQIRLVQGLMRERTRTAAIHKQSARKTHVELIRNASVRAVQHNARVQCPFLDPNGQYVAFGGNLKKLRGRGYQLIGKFDEDPRRLGGWLRRLGYGVSCGMEEARIWKWIGIMLGDLSKLSCSLGVVTAAIDKHGQWRRLSELEEMVKDARFHSWLKSCSLRIYAPADYLVRWRRWFAERLGYSYIPGGDWSAPEGTICREADSPSAELIRAQMKAGGILAKQLAAHVGWTEPRVSRQLNGKTPLSDELIAAAKELIPGLCTEPIARAAD